MPARSKRRSRTKPSKAPIIDQDKFLRKMGYSKLTRRDKRRTNEHLLAPLNAVPPKLPPLANSIPGGVAPKRDKLIDYRWKGGESKDAIEAALEKAKRVAPGGNKQGLEYHGDSIAEAVKNIQRRS